MTDTRHADSSEHQLLAFLVEAVYAEHRSGRPPPARLELPPADFERFQSEHREALAAHVPEVGNVYPGSLAGVPVESGADHPSIIRADGRRGMLLLP
ncbi:hypothetical protein ASF11_15940 [Acidovorax sp. Leaf76]|jgi:hypothetical protein|uniref:hypothetical protein n=1 Tax=unclassified Acidovorax TaxID=2684926 RepID=UPI0006F3F150|nr:MULTISPECIES: hypothetical protein [unclassified Acidovorax]KQO12524.1 hypothetical protein ASF11_15940 [Acidovorax sp. Leaf76]KQO30133.1 hypothetical protein ASF19_13620 [Acidovorax sp. Leaf84]KQS28799.1 hypothetical protein ASG27_10920 [Acidovorax sp. Leaf191]